MELDVFCDSTYTWTHTWTPDKQCDTYADYLKSIGTDEFIPRTDNPNINKYFIRVNMWENTKHEYDMKFVFYRLGNVDLDKRYHSMDDITELYNALDMDKPENYITFHNYCCKRLREEINRLHPEFSLVKINKKGRY